MCFKAFIRMAKISKSVEYFSENYEMYLESSGRHNEQVEIFF